MKFAQLEQRAQRTHTNTRWARARWAFPLLIIIININSISIIIIIITSFESLVCSHSRCLLMLVCCFITGFFLRFVYKFRSFLCPLTTNHQHSIIFLSFSLTFPLKLTQLFSQSNNNNFCLFLCSTSSTSSPVDRLKQNYFFYLSIILTQISALFLSLQKPSAYANCCCCYLKWEQ